MTLHEDESARDESTRLDNDTSGQPEKAEYHSPFQTVTDTALIPSLLRRTQEAHMLLSVSLSDVPGRYNSLLIEVDPDNDCLTLDELHPGEGHDRVHAGSRLHVMTRLHGVEILFELHVGRIETVNGVAMYYCPQPQRVQHLQRREHYRARTPLGASIEVSLRIGVNAVIEGELVDLSAGGLAVRCKDLGGHAFTRGEQLSDCVLPLPGLRQPLRCTLEVRNQHDEKHGGHFLIRLAFVGLDQRQQQQVSRVVASLDRQHRPPGGLNPSACSRHAKPASSPHLLCQPGLARQASRVLE